MFDRLFTWRDHTCIEVLCKIVLIVSFKSRLTLTVRVCSSGVQCVGHLVIYLLKYSSIQNWLSGQIIKCASKLWALLSHYPVRTPDCSHIYSTELTHFDLLEECPLTFHHSKECHFNLLLPYSLQFLHISVCFL